MASRPPPTGEEADEDEHYSVGVPTHETTSIKKKRKKKKKKKTSNPEGKSKGNIGSVADLSMRKIDLGNTQQTMEEMESPLFLDASHRLGTVPEEESPEPMATETAPTENAPDNTEIAPSDVPGDVPGDAKSVSSERGGRHKTFHFDLSHRMGFVISHNEESLLVHVIQISPEGQAKEKGVEVGWIIDKVDGHNISDHDEQLDDFGNERTRIVQKIVLERTQKFREAAKRFESSTGKCDITRDDLEQMKWLKIEFLIPDEVKDNEMLENAQNIDKRHASVKYQGKIPVQFRGEEEPVMRSIGDLPELAPAQLLKRNPGLSGDKRKWVCLHKFALYYSRAKLDYEALEAFDSKINKEGEKAKINSEAAVIPLRDVIDARVAKLGNKLILNLKNRKVVTFKRLPDREDDLFEWADTIIDHKAFFVGLMAHQKSNE
mmetsp:Transcript_37063/g.71848  ORF Transcript_37063/g.71848 Transcript_37063/m.71848 type:complete len:433 (+) Transcript_37063:1-1299(+)